jgi:hypothetical protein
MYKADKHKIIKLPCCNIKTVWQWATSRTSSQPIIFRLQYVYKQLSRSSWYKSDLVHMEGVKCVVSGGAVYNIV